MTANSQIIYDTSRASIPCLTKHHRSYDAADPVQIMWRHIEHLRDGLLL